MSSIRVLLIFVLLFNCHNFQEYDDSFGDPNAYEYVPDSGTSAQNHEYVPDSGNSAQNHEYVPDSGNSAQNREHYGNGDQEADDSNDPDSPLVSEGTSGINPRAMGPKGTAVRNLFNLCGDPSIDAAVRVSASSEYMLVFKAEYYWFLNVKTNNLTESKLISNDFKFYNRGDLRNIEAAWVASGFDAFNRTAGSIHLLKSNLVVRYEVNFDNELKYNVKYNNNVDFNTFWPHTGQTHNVINAITQMNTINEKEVQSGGPRDLLILSDNNYAIVWSRTGNDMRYETKFNLYAKSEKGSNKLSFFDPQTRDLMYWNNFKSEPLSAVLQIKALVFFPTTYEVFAFGKQEFCKINIKSSAMDLKCQKTNTGKLFGCQSPATTPPPIVTVPPTPPSAGNGSTDTQFPTNLTVETTGKDEPGGVSTSQSHLSTTRGEVGLADENQKGGKGSNVIYYIIGAVILLFLIIAIIALVGFLYTRKSGATKKQSEDSITQGPLDPRYGQIDSSLNLTLKIANPSVASLDRYMAEQNRSDEIKSESESSVGKTVKTKSTTSQVKSKSEIMK